MFDFLVFVYGVAVTFWLFRITERLRKLEIGNLQASPLKKEIESSVKQKAQSLIDETTPSEFVRMNHKGNAEATIIDNALENFLVWLKTDWLMKIGALFLILGFAWFASFAFLANWIGPMGRIALGIAFGVLLMAFGWTKLKSEMQQGAIFLVIGSAATLLTLFAARAIYGFFTPTSVLVVMFLVSFFVALASVLYRNNTLAIIGLFMACAAPMMIKAPSSDHVGLFSYLLIVILGAVWVLWLTENRALPLLALLFAYLYSLPHFFTPLKYPDTLLLFGYAFFVVFFVSNIASYAKRTYESYAVETATALLNGSYLLLWIATVAPTDWHSIITAAWTLVFAVGTFMIYQTGKVRNNAALFQTYAAMGLVFLGVATAFQLKGASLTLALIFEISVLIILSHRVTANIRLARNLLPLYLVPALMTMYSIERFAYTDFLNKDFFVILFMAFSLIGVGYYILINLRDDDSEKLLAKASLVFGSLFAFDLIWQTMKGVFYGYVDYIPVYASLLIFLIIGLYFHFDGIAKELKERKTYGTFILVMVFLRILLIDVWQMDISGKIITFFTIGGLLIVTAFNSKSSKLKRNENK